MSLTEFEEVIKKIKPYTDTIYLHIKGEPFLYTKLNELLSICDQEQMKVNITTNGTLLKQKLEDIQNHSCIKHLNFSLHSENKKKNYLEEIMENVNKLSPEIVIIYRFWTLKNYELDKKTSDIVEKMKHYYNLSTEIVDKLKTEQNIKIAPNIYVDKANLFEWPSESSNNLKEGYCLGGKTHIGILSDGTVVPCCLDAEGEIVLGNIFTSSMDSIIKGDRYQNLIKGFQNRKPTEKLCQKCSYKERFDYQKNM